MLTPDAARAAVEHVLSGIPNLITRGLVNDSTISVIVERRLQGIGEKVTLCEHSAGDSTVGLQSDSLAREALQNRIGMQTLSFRLSSAPMQMPPLTFRGSCAEVMHRLIGQIRPPKAIKIEERTMHFYTVAAGVAGNAPHINEMLASWVEACCIAHMEGEALQLLAR